MEATIKTFFDLHAWQRAHELVLLVYRFTKGFPKDERYGLVDQLRRAAVSVTSNIAEGFGRNSKLEKIQFYSVALGSVAEVQNQLVVAKDVKYLRQSDFDHVFPLTVDVHKLIQGLMKGAKSRYS